MSLRVGLATDGDMEIAVFVSSGSTNVLSILSQALRWVMEHVLSGLFVILLVLIYDFLAASIMLISILMFGDGEASDFGGQSMWFFRQKNDKCVSKSKGQIEGHPYSEWHDKDARGTINPSSA